MTPTEADNLPIGTRIRWQHPHHGPLVGTVLATRRGGHVTMSNPLPNDPRRALFLGPDALTHSKVLS